MMREVRSRTEALQLPHEELFESQVMLLRTLMLAVGAREVLELGTFLGYGAASLVDALDSLGGGRVTTVDRDVELSKRAQASVSARSDLTSIDFVTGDAAVVCADFLDSGRRFDLIILDVAEPEYPALYEGCIELLDQHGILVVDNVMMATAGGWESGENVVQGPKSEVLSALRNLMAMAAGDARVWASVVPLGSGLLLCAKR